MKDANLEGDPFDDLLLNARCQELLYKNRWQPLAKALRELDSLSMELEVVWGPSVAKNIRPLKECIHRLWSAIKSYVSDEIKQPTNYFATEIARKNHEIISSAGEDNPFSAEITDAVRQIENFLKPYLKI